MATPEQAALLEQQDLRLLGTRIRDVRRASGRGQANVAADVGVSISYVSRIEAGKRRCDIVLLEKIADSLQVPLDALLVPPEDAQASSQNRPIRPPELDFAALALEMGDAPSVISQLDELQVTLDSVWERESLLLRGRATEVLGDLSRAIEILERIELPSEDPIADVGVAIALSRCYRESGEMLRAIRVGEAALDHLASASLTGTDESVQLAVTVAAAYFDQGDREYAVRLCRRTITSAEQTGTPRARASAYWNFAIMELESGRVDVAVQTARRALALLGEGQDRRNLARLRGELGLMEMRLSPPDLEQAERNLLAAQVDFTDTSAGHVDRQRMEVALARLDQLRGNSETARSRSVSVGEELATSVPQLAAEALVIAGESAFELGDQPMAHDLFRRAVGLLVAVDNVRAVGQLWLELGEQLQAVGDAAAAADAFRRAAVSAGLTAPGPAHIRVQPGGHPRGD